jgi:hypothetical protein
VSIEGYYKTDEMPSPPLYVPALVDLPRLQVLGVVHFLIDTGADTTCLHPRDIARLGIDYRRLRRNTVASYVGVGGSLEYYQEPGQLRFLDTTGNVISWRLGLRLSTITNSPGIEGLPSLLGRDFISVCSFQADQSKDRIILDPLNIVDNSVLPST